MFDACYTLEKFLRETDGSLDAARAAFDDAFACPYYDTKLVAQTFMDAYAGAGSLRPAGARGGEAHAAETFLPLDTALGALYKTLTECALPRMMAKENESAAAAGEATASPSRRRGGAGAAAGAPASLRPARGAGDRVLDWLEFPAGFERYAFALEEEERRSGTSANGDGDGDGDGDEGGSRASYAHEAGYDAFMTGVCFLAMTLHARSVVPVDGDGVVRVFGNAKSAGSTFSATASDGRVLRPRNFVGDLGASPFANADGAVPLQMCDVGVLRLRGAQPRVPPRAGVVVFTGVAPGLSVSALAPRFVAAGLGAPWQVVWIGKNTLRVTFRSGTAEDTSAGPAAAARFAAEVSRRLLAVGTRVEAVDWDTWRRREEAERAAARAAEALERAHDAGVDIETLAAATRKKAGGGRKRGFDPVGVLFGGRASKAARRGGSVAVAGEAGATTVGRVGGDASQGETSRTGCVIS